MQEFFFYFICAACNFFSSTKGLQEFFFKITHPPPPPQELNGRPLKRGVKQGDPLSPYLFIMVLEVLAISIREKKNIQRILVGGTESKLFADDLTAFLRNDQSFDEILDVIAKFGKCTGLTVNFAKTEMLLLGNPAVPTFRQATAKVKIKKAVKILGVHFTNDRHLGRKLNFEEIIVY